MKTSKSTCNQTREPRLRHQPRPAYIHFAWHWPVKERLVRPRTATLATISALFIVFVSAFGQSKPAGVVPTAELQKLVPAAYFYRGQSASVQVRNSGAIRTKDQKYVIAALVDT